MKQASFTGPMAKAIVLTLMSLPSLASSDAIVTKPCECIGDETRLKEIKENNRKFIEGHIRRLVADIKALEEKLNPKSTVFKTLRPWQIEADQQFLGEKKDALTRVRGYQAKLEKFPHVHLIVDDLYVDFTPEDCGELRLNLDSEVILYKFSKRISPSEQKSAAERLGRTLELRCRQPEADLEKGESDTEAALCTTCGQGMSDSYNPATLAGMPVKEPGCGEKVACVNDPDQFLGALGVSTLAPRAKRSEKDLSNIFTSPEGQGKSDACAGFAVGADLEAELYKRSLGGFEISKPDPWGIYRTMRGQANGNECHGKRENIEYRGGTPMAKGLLNLTKSSLCLPDSDLRLHIKKSIILQNTKDVGIEFFQRLIDADKPVVVALKTDKMKVHEDWSKPIASPGGLDHVVTVVGYGVGTNPHSLQEEPYVVVRDSLYPHPRHLKLGLSDLRKNINGVLKLQNFDLKKD